LKSNISNLARQQTRIAQQQIEALLRETLIQNPKTVLSKGYAIVRQQGHAVRSVHELESEVQVEMQDGTFVANIIQVNPHE